ncbi:hypothetical protein GGR57DRAFT_508048 [Xylariaceae sp. FL1272]|nr:hypothetical protein GGR57DRAFT_508048 [Xylariaceae sp. FL1272]
MTQPGRKRIIVCCDGTWQNSDNGYLKASKKHNVPKLQTPSNVTRISRCFRRTCTDGTSQIIYYQSGVGSRAGSLNRILGGAFGIGISENIREAYSFICANYLDGDEIVLLGFSRGAFTARSVGGMISDLGLLTREGMEYFYPVFKDMQNWRNSKYKDPFPTQPFTNKPKGQHAAANYRERLLEFYNTRLSNKIQHGFHALALDETRGPFSPTLWERRPQEQDTSDLRQVWFPGSHANIGGGWPDQGVADITLAWMMDQLSSVGVEFLPDSLNKLFERTTNFYQHHTHNRLLDRCAACVARYSGGSKLNAAMWAEKSIYEADRPVRPWALHAIESSRGMLAKLAGSVTRTPGMYHKINPVNGRALPEFLEDTNERIHPSVRVRLACEGLGLNDTDLWHCASLLKYWRPRRVPEQFYDPVSRTAEWGPPPKDKGRGRAPTTVAPEQSGPSDYLSLDHSFVRITSVESLQSLQSLQMLSTYPTERWVWEYIGPQYKAPVIRMMVEENMGPFEKGLLELAAGKVHVCKFAEKQEVSDFKAYHHRKFRKTIKEVTMAEKREERRVKRKAKRSKTRESRNRASTSTSTAGGTVPGRAVTDTVNEGESGAEAMVTEKPTA